MSVERKTLDELLQEIHEGALAGEIREVKQSSGDPAIEALTARMLAEAAAAPPPHPESPILTPTAAEVLFGTAPLTKRQRALPKLNLAQTAGGLVAVLFLVMGVGSATYLTQQSQDVRQQASDGRLVQYQAVLNEVSQQQAVDTVQWEAQAQQEKEQSQRMLFGSVLILVGVALLVGALFWLFAV